MNSIYTGIHHMHVYIYVIGSYARSVEVKVSHNHPQYRNNRKRSSSRDSREGSTNLSEADTSEVRIDMMMIDDDDDSGDDDSGDDDDD